MRVINRRERILRSFSPMVHIIRLFLFLVKEGGQASGGAVLLTFIEIGKL
jgi:hypothetical protein